MADNLAEVVRLMLVTDDRVLAGRDLVAACRAAVRGGVTLVQLRLKSASARELAGLGAELRRLPVPVIVNDRADVALAGGLAGVHLGTDDVPPELIRRIAPPGFVIGASVGVESEIAPGEPADYWGIGPWRVTATKADAGAALGAEGFARLAARSGGRPCVAIGSVRPEDVPAVLAAGGAGVAVVSGILGGSDPETAARHYATAFIATG